MPDHTCARRVLSWDGMPCGMWCCRCCCAVCLCRHMRWPPRSVSGAGSSHISVSRRDMCASLPAEPRCLFVRLVHVLPCLRSFLSCVCVQLARSVYAWRIWLLSRSTRPHSINRYKKGHSTHARNTETQQHTTRQAHKHTSTQARAGTSAGGYLRVCCSCVCCDAYILRV